MPGASVPYPYGGKQRRVRVDLNTTPLQSGSLSALDVTNAISVQNLILPTGTSKIGSREYNVSIPNAAPQTIEDLNRIPIKTVGGTTIYIRDVAWVRDGFPPQTNIVRVNGQRSVLLTIQKANASDTKRDSLASRLCNIKSGHRSAAAKYRPAGGSIYFCAWRDQWGRAGNADCRVPHGFHDPRLSGQLAKHRYHHNLYTASNPDLHHRV